MTTSAETSTSADAAAYFVALCDTKEGGMKEGSKAFEPTRAAGGHWGEELISGPAVAGLAAHAIEAEYGQAGFLPARFTIDLMKPARQVTTRTQVRLIRQGRRVRYIECDVLQDDRIVARATAVQYRLSEAPTGREWTPDAEFQAPRDADGHDLVVGSDSAGWSVLGVEHQNTDRKRAYFGGIDAVSGQHASAFVRAVVVAESAANMVINLGTTGIGYINGDLTVSLSRLPAGGAIGVQGDSRFAAEGVSVGTATLFDAQGPFGTTMITALANPAARIDFAGAARTEAPGSELFGIAS